MNDIDRGNTQARRRVLVTGAASGLGAALVSQFRQRGDQVLATDLGDDDPGETTYLRLDVTSTDDWQRARQWVSDCWDGLDVLINNAGVATGGRIDVLGEQDWLRGLDVNLMGVVRGCQTFVPAMKAQRGGHIVNIASLAGLVHPPGMAAYNAAKAAVVALSETLQFELAPWGIVTSAVCPSYFRTNITTSLSGADPLLDAVATRLISGSEASADQIAGAVMRGIDEDQELILTDVSGQQAYTAKHHDPATYRQQQMAFAGRLYDLDPNGAS